jgi:hypothetical protein
VQYSNRLNIAVAGLGLAFGAALGRAEPHLALPIAGILGVPFAAWVVKLAFFTDDSGVRVSLGDIDSFWGSVYGWILHRRVISYHNYLSGLRFKLPSKTPIIKLTTSRGIAMHTMLGDSVDHDPVIEIPVDKVCDRLTIARAYGNWCFFEMIASQVNMGPPNPALPLDMALHRHQTYASDLALLAENYFADCFAGVKFSQSRPWIFKWVSALLRIRLDTSETFCDGSVAYAVRIALRWRDLQSFDDVFRVAFSEGMRQISSGGYGGKIDTANGILRERGLIQ